MNNNLNLQTSSNTTMKMFRLVLVAMMALTLAACGGKSKKTDFFKEEVAPKKPKVTNQTELKRHWRIGVGGGIKAGDGIISPALFGDSIYVAAANGRVAKVSAETGKQVWQIKLKKETLTAGVGVGSGLVLVASDQGIVYALNQEDGSIDWQVQLSSEVLASPAVGEDVIVARTGDGKVYGLAAYDGEILWTISRQLPRLTLRGASKPLVFSGVVFTGFSDGTLAAVEAKTGRALWDFPISFPRGTTEIDRLADIDTDPLLVGNNIYVSSYQEVTHALDIQQQRISWSADVSSYHPLAYDAAYLYITDKQGSVHQIDRTNGKKVWSQNGLRLSNVSAPVSLGSFVLVSDGKSNLYVLDKSSGKFLGRHGLGAKNIVGEAIVDGDTVYLLDQDGDLQSLSLSKK